MTEALPVTANGAERAGTHSFDAPRGRYCIRTARPDDEEALRRMLEHATPADIHLRFFRYMRYFPHEFIEPMIRGDDRRYFSFVAVPENEEDSIAGTAMLAAEPDGRAAEFGIIVDRSHGGQRLGTHLMQCLLREARAHAIALVYGTILLQNADMIDLVQRLGFRVMADPEDAACVRVELPIGAPVKRPA